MTATLTGERVEVPDDVVAFSEDALRRGWSDGLPCVPPTEERVQAYVEASGLDAQHTLGILYPLGIDCTVELLAVNAVMAGAPAAAMPLMAACVSAMADQAFDLAGINATTASVVPAFVVSGPVRDELGLPYKHSAIGGAAGPAPAIGRALRLLVRNVAGQVAGLSSESVFGQPGRVTGIVTSEWLEESPWPSLGERRGFPGDSVTVFGVLGTANILNSYGSSGSEILEVVGKSLSYMGNNNMDHSAQFAHQLVALNPVWARIVAREFPDMQDVQERLYHHSAVPIENFPESLHGPLQEAHDVRSDGKVYLMDTPEDVSVIVNGGKGSLHACMFPAMSNMLPVTRSLNPETWQPPTGTSD
ncbi:hypothetical protein SAMN05892883_1249 [Jatrophihabitans sp. GAS493]|uniref:hypothetical protein n=1 Tax=Jatrophihabitans sp. GAS493 TaxID=1907575 RepID=UPI000BBF4408|nr:hypothetical protein [Jatrophihabitans sp. GAS493]SOD71777.1 hypothetical protein SAMN05892883_1249 [Jatrophihabitans sp. GAS493]